MIAKLRTEAKLKEIELQTLNSQVDDFGILIPVDEIASMTLYHASLHAKYFLPVEKGGHCSLSGVLRSGELFLAAYSNDDRQTSVEFQFSV